MVQKGRERVEKEGGQRTKYGHGSRRNREVRKGRRHDEKILRDEQWGMKVRWMDKVSV